MKILRKSTDVFRQQVSWIEVRLLINRTHVMRRQSGMSLGMSLKSQRQSWKNAFACNSFPYSPVYWHLRWPNINDRVVFFAVHKWRLERSGSRIELLLDVKQKSLETAMAFDGRLTSQVYLIWSCERRFLHLLFYSIHFRRRRNSFWDAFFSKFCVFFVVGKHFHSTLAQLVQFRGFSNYFLI